MNLDVAIARDQAEAIDAACEFLQVDREAFFALADRWETLGPELWAQQAVPETFYTAWRGEPGQSNLCRNVIDQFTRKDVIFMLDQVLGLVDAAWMLDYGCGTGVVSYAVADRCRQLVQADVPNLPSEFVRWRIERDGRSHVAGVDAADALRLPDESFNVIACIDVLEHLPQPTAILEQLDRLLQREGILLFRAPWAREAEDFDEHLPAATADWHRAGGGADRLRLGYQLIGEMSHGGVYQKR